MRPSAYKALKAYTVAAWFIWAAFGQVGVLGWQVLCASAIAGFVLLYVYNEEDDED